MSSERMRIPWEDQGRYKKIITQGSNMWAEVVYDGKGHIDEKQTYNPNYLKKLREEREEQKEKEDERRQESKSSSSNNGKGCLKKILLSPFKLIWWLIKFIFWLVFWSWLSSVLGISKDDN